MNKYEDLRLGLVRDAAMAALNMQRHIMYSMQYFRSLAKKEMKRDFYYKPSISSFEDDFQLGRSPDFYQQAVRADQPQDCEVLLEKVFEEMRLQLKEVDRYKELLLQDFVDLSQFEKARASSEALVESYKSHPKEIADQLGIPSEEDHTQKSPAESAVPTS